MKVLKALCVLSLISLTGCWSETQFIPTTENKSQGVTRKLSEVSVFTDSTQVPWPYTVIGQLYPDKQPSTTESPKDQIESLKTEAWLQGADAIIVSHESQNRGNGAVNLVAGFGASYQRGLLVFTGIAIRKKDVIAAVPPAIVSTTAKAP